MFQVFQQLQVRTTVEIPDGDFMGVEDFEEFFDSGFGEMHANNSDDHGWLFGFWLVSIKLRMCALTPGE
jgi:hypothetical protein